MNCDSCVAAAGRYSMRRIAYIFIESKQIYVAIDRFNSFCTVPWRSALEGSQV